MLAASLQSRDNCLELFSYAFWLKIRPGKINLFVVFILLSGLGFFSTMIIASPAYRRSLFFFYSSKYILEDKM